MLRVLPRPRAAARWKRSSLFVSLAVTGALILPTAVVTAADPQTFTVMVDGATPDNGSAFVAFFPDQISVHPGDTIDFPLFDSGEPHTVTGGTVVDEAMAAIAALPPDADQAAAMAIPAIAKVPELISEEPGDANQVAANPCFIVEGDLPTDSCMSTEQPAFEGTDTFYNSGWLTESSDFSITLADDIAPGSYTFICLLHWPDMRVTVNVVDAATPVTSPDEVAAAAQAQVDDAVAKIQAAEDAMSGNPPDQAMAGVLSQDVPYGLGITFEPRDISIPAGGSVTWTVLGPHTVSFNAPQDAVGPRMEAPDGSAHVNPAVFMPSNSPGQVPSTSPPDPNAPPTLIDAGEWDGTGFLSSGLIVSFPPALSQYRVTFTQPGSYTYQCLVHPNMRGTVTVTS